MADFKPFFDELMKDESYKITNDQNDRGGFTVAGVSQKANPNSPIFARVKELGLKVGDVLPPSEIPLLKNFYKANYWDRCWCDGIDSQESASSIANFAVNAGVKPAITLCQKALGLPETGIMSQTALDALNNVNGFSI